MHPVRGLRGECPEGRFFLSGKGLQSRPETGYPGVMIFAEQRLGDWRKWLLNCCHKGRELAETLRVSP